MADTNTSMSEQFAAEMVAKLNDTLVDAQKLASACQQLTGTDPIERWIRENYAHLFKADVEIVPSASPQTENSDFEGRKLSARGKLVEAIQSNPDKWWTYDEIMQFWSSLGDPINNKSALRTAVSQLKAKGSDNEQVEIHVDGGLVRAWRPARLLDAKGGMV